MKNRRKRKILNGHKLKTKEKKLEEFKYNHTGY